MYSIKYNNINSKKKKKNRVMNTEPRTIHLHVPREGQDSISLIGPIHLTCIQIIYTRVTLNAIYILLSAVKEMVHRYSCFIIVINRRDVYFMHSSWSVREHT